MLNNARVMLPLLLAAMSAHFAMATPALATDPAPISAESVGDASLPQSVKVMDKELAIKNNTFGKAGEFIAEYIPKNETWDNWTIMFAVRFVPDKTLEPQASARATADKVIARRKNGDPVANAAVYEQDAGKSAAVDFLISANDTGLLEHNVFRWYKTDKGLVSFQIAERMYASKTNDQQMQNFIKEIPTVRLKIFKELTRSDLPITRAAR